MIEIEIDGQKCEAQDGSMIIEAADTAGIAIPRFCYHKKLSIAANCRMCLVEVEKVGKPVPACATPVTPGMRVFTQSDKAREAQKSVMEFLLINHPLDCPICDQGGQCELQDVAMGYGRDDSRYDESKRAVDDDNLGSLIATEMTRCIHCTRCVRFGDEIAGLREMGATGRGEHTHIGTYVKHSMTSELSGNIIDVCPVGALTSKPFRFRARAWELQQGVSISPHDAIGSALSLHTRNNEVMRVVPRENENLNEVWLSDRDRFSYTALQSSERVSAPLIKRDGKWEETNWDEALHYTVERLRKVTTQYSASQIGAVISPNATLEEHYLFQKLLRALDCHNIDHRLQETDFSDQANLPLFLDLGCKVAELENRDVVLLVGSNIHHEQPIAGLRLRKGAIKNTRVLAINPLDVTYHFPLADKMICAPQQWVQEFAAIVKAVAANKKQDLPATIKSALASTTMTATHEKFAATLVNAKQGTIILGALANNHPQASLLRCLTHALAALTGMTCGVFTAGANSAGAWIAGSVPHRTVAGQAVAHAGLDVNTQFGEKLKSYLLFNVEPELDCACPGKAISALAEADFVVSFSPFRGGILEAQADVILPIAPFAENAGTLVNAEGQWQSFAAAVVPMGQTRPGWKVLRVLGNLLELTGFDYIHAEQIRDEVRALVNNAAVAPESVEYRWNSLGAKTSGLMRITEWPMYRCDNIVRRSIPLQESAANEMVAVYLNANLAKALNVSVNEKVAVTQNSNPVELSVVISDGIPDQCVYIPAGYSKTAKLGESFGSVEIKKL